MTVIKESMNKTWFVDLDGTVLKHQTNESIDDLMKLEDGYKQEEALPAAIQFFQNIPKGDVIVITTARLSRHITHTLKVLDNVGMPYDDYIFGIAQGPRVVVNDVKPQHTPGIENESELTSAFSVNVPRDDETGGELRSSLRRMNTLLTDQILLSDAPQVKVYEPSFNSETGQWTLLTE